MRTYYHHWQKLCRWTLAHWGEGRYRYSLEQLHRTGQEGQCLPTGPGGKSGIWQGGWVEIVRPQDWRYLCNFGRSMDPCRTSAILAWKKYCTEAKFRPRKLFVIWRLEF